MGFVSDVLSGCHLKSFFLRRFSMKRNLITLAVFAVLMTATPAFTQNPCNPCGKRATNPCGQKATNPCNPCHATVSNAINKDSNRLANRGFDSVAYFTESKAIQGRSRFSYEYGGATWHFASAANRDLFAHNPQRYAPQYGGYCAYAVSQGALADGDPRLWKVVNGKLYLNLNKRIQRTWKADITGYITKADNNWPKVLEG